MQLPAASRSDPQPKPPSWTFCWPFPHAYPDAVTGPRKVLLSIMFPPFLFPPPDSARLTVASPIASRSCTKTGPRSSRFAASLCGFALAMSHISWTRFVTSTLQNGGAESTPWSSSVGFEAFFPLDASRRPSTSCDSRGRLQSPSGRTGWGRITLVAFLTVDGIADFEIPRRPTVALCSEVSEASKDACIDVVR